MKQWKTLGIILGRVVTSLRRLLGPVRQCWMYDHDMLPGSTWRLSRDDRLPAGHYETCRRCQREVKTRDLTAEEHDRLAAYAADRRVA